MNIFGNGPLPEFVTLSPYTAQSTLPSGPPFHSLRNFRVTFLILSQSIAWQAQARSLHPAILLLRQLITKRMWYKQLQLHDLRTLWNFFYWNFYWAILCYEEIISMIRYITTIAHLGKSMVTSAWRHKNTSVTLPSDLADEKRGLI